ncbi:MAG: S-layer homology domain-containing protein [Chloroflexota bacterium]
MWKVLAALILAVHFLGGALVANAENGSESPETVRGQLIVLWGDTPNQATETRYYLHTDKGQILRVNPSEAQIQSLGGAGAANRQWVTVTGTRSAVEGEAVIKPVTLTMEGGQRKADVNPMVSESQPWVTIMCKFSDIPTEPRDLSYFQGMYDAAWPSLDHYWRELSYDAINLTGSGAFGWFTLPNPRSFYIQESQMGVVAGGGGGGGNANLFLLATDCTAAADANVDFTKYAGINLIFNEELNGAAWGGATWLTVDGVEDFWRTTWLPPWGYTDLAVTSHEMGHGFGLPHSLGPSGGEYDNVWDVMSASGSHCDNSRDATYGCLGQHTISYHKDLLGWIPKEQKFLAPDNNDMAPGESSSFTITLEQLALPQTANYKMAEIPIGMDAGSYYTMEARRKVGYDVKLPGEGIIIHKVDLGVATVVGTDNNVDPAASVWGGGGGGGVGTSGDGFIWTVGETFTDIRHGISVTVDSATQSGYTVTITIGPDAPPVFADVPGTYWAWQHIERLYSAGITGGCTSTPLNYCPETAVTREQMAVFLLVAEHGAGYTPPPATGLFSDVPASNGFAPWIEQMASEGIAGGCGAGNFCPGNPVTREQMAVFLLVAKHGAGYTPPAAVGMFSDVPAGNPFAEWIEQLANEGITGGCGGGKFCPQTPVTRAQMAVFLVAAFNLP